MNNEVENTVKQWLAKAGDDWDTVEILTAHPRCPRNSVCFHCQQYAEKLLKALLTFHEVEFPKTHNLRRLIQIAESKAPALKRLIDKSDQLTAYNLISRYPDDWVEINLDDMQAAVDLAEEFGDLIKPLLSSVK